MASFRKIVVHDRNDFDEFLNNTITHLKLIKSSLELWLLIEKMNNSVQKKYVEAEVNELIDDIEDFIYEDHQKEKQNVIYGRIEGLLNQVKSFKTALNEISHCYN